MISSKINCLFLDIGGVLLTDGWNHHARKRAATNFKLEFAEMEYRQAKYSGLAWPVIERQEKFYEGP